MWAARDEVWVGVSCKRLLGGASRVSAVGEGESLRADVVGPVCESSDFLGKDREFVGLQEGDWLAIAEAGAYGYSMVSLYNSFPLPREILF